MKRKIYSKLLEWKLSTRRKPLILKGARQVGKSWILKDFGRKEYKYLAYISCDNEEIAKGLFIDYDIQRIIRSVEAISKVPVLKNDTLIVFDEIQEIRRGLTALKYFCEDAPDYHVAVAGSLLGITLSQGNSFPVGKVDFLEMFPMDFEEYLWANNEEKIAAMIAEGDISDISALHTYLDKLLRSYYFCGGMPEAVRAFSEGVGPLGVRKIQDAILEAYRNDIGKHAPLREVQRIHMVMQSLPSQLAKENKKFVYSAIRKGARASEFEIAIQWLVDAGIIIKVSRLNKPALPTAFYEDFNAFKLYLLDCGLFGAMVNSDPAIIMSGEKLYTEYKGAFSEGYVCQQLTAQSLRLFYYSTSNSQVEIDFITEIYNNIFPIEVKAEGNVKGKSMKLFLESNNLPIGFRFSMLPFRQQANILNLPLFTAFALRKYSRKDGFLTTK